MLLGLLSLGSTHTKNQKTSQCVGLKSSTREGKAGEKFEGRMFIGQCEEKREGAIVINVLDARARNSREKPERWIIYQNTLEWECTDNGYHIF